MFENFNLDTNDDKIFWGGLFGGTGLTTILFCVLLRRCYKRKMRKINRVKYLGGSRGSEADYRINSGNHTNKVELEPKPPLMQKGITNVVVDNGAGVVNGGLSNLPLPANIPPYEQGQNQVENIKHKSYLSSPPSYRVLAVTGAKTKKRIIIERETGTQTDDDIVEQVRGCIGTQTD